MVGPGFVSVVVCTHDRSHLLPALVSDLVAQCNQPVTEVLIVDNASTDDTPAVLAELDERFAAVRVVHEPQLGLSHARNRGLREAGGDIVCWTDDDAVVAPGWAAALAEPFGNERVVATGGPIRLAWPDGHPPPWVPERSMTLYSELDLGEQPRELVYPTSPWGANFAVRRRPALAAGGFRHDLGRRGRRLGGSEETELLLRLAADGGEVRWVPDAEVTQLLDADRTRRSWLVRRGFWQGWSEARVSAAGAPANARAERLDDGLRTLPEALTHPSGPGAMLLTTELARAVGRVLSAASARWRPRARRTGVGQ